MTANDFVHSASLRASLKRGLARQALAHAASDSARVEALVALADRLGPNRKTICRMGRKLGAMPGVIRVAATPDARGLVVICRSLRLVTTRAGGQDVFCEQAIMYTRLRIRCERAGHGYDLSRVSLCAHAMERFVERGSHPLDRPLLPAIDAEAIHMLRCFAKGQAITDAGDCYGPARENGLWAGSFDDMALEENWGLRFAAPEDRLPVFSVRTFLSPEEMRPTLWAKWRADPGLTVSC